MAPPDRRLYPWTAQGSLAPLTITSASGSWFVDAAGNRHLDLGGQLAYMNIGHGHPTVVEAIRRQAAELPVIGPAFANRPAARLAEMLAEVTPGDLNRTFFTNGGAEAVEYAIRMPANKNLDLEIADTLFRSPVGSMLRRIWALPFPTG